MNFFYAFLVTLRWKFNKNLNGKVYLKPQDLINNKTSLIGNDCLFFCKNECEFAMNGYKCLFYESQHFFF